MQRSKRAELEKRTISTNICLDRQSSPSPSSSPSTCHHVPFFLSAQTSACIGNHHDHQHCLHHASMCFSPCQHVFFSAHTSAHIDNHNHHHHRHHHAIVSFSQHKYMYVSAIITITSSSPSSCHHVIFSACCLIWITKDHLGCCVCDFF